MIRRGFTLLELLVAMAIFATAGMAIMQTSSGHIRQLSQLEELTLASYIAADRMQLALLDKDWPGKEQSHGQVEMANRKWQWQQRISKITDDDLRLVEISVSLADTPQEVIYQLQSYKGRPNG